MMIRFVYGMWQREIRSRCSNDDTVRLWDVATGDQKQVFNGHNTHGVNSVSFSPDGRTLASGSNDGIVLLWELR